MIKVINAHFVQSCERFSQAPSILGAEIAILGRSNVGKSSLINALLNNKNLAKSSSTPGKTRLVNFFNAKWRVDSADSQNLGGNQIKIAESSADSANSQNLGENILSLRDSAEQNRGKPLIKKIAESAESSVDSAIISQNGLQETSHSLVLPRSPALARNDEFILDSAISKQDANSSIFDEKSGLCSCERENRTKGSLTKRATNLPDLSQKDDEFAVRILDFPGFGYAKVSKTEKSSWDKHLSEFLKKRDSIKLYLHLIDSRHQNLEIDNEIFAFLNRFKRGDCAILQVFTKADKLSKNELSRLKNQNKLYHSINDKNSTEILRYAILKILYNVDF